MRQSRRNDDSRTGLFHFRRLKPATIVIASQDRPRTNRKTDSHSGTVARAELLNHKKKRPQLQSELRPSSVSALVWHHPRFKNTPYDCPVCSLVNLGTGPRLSWPTIATAPDFPHWPKRTAPARGGTLRPLEVSQGLQRHGPTIQ
jgi:hypothetical protein